MRELSASAAPDSVRALIEHRPRWLRSQEPDEHVLSTITTDLHRGERAALALALELKADLLLIDDAAGRREALSLGLRVTGTVGVLRVAAERGLVDVPPLVERLRQSGFYIQESVLRAALGQWLPS